MMTIEEMRSRKEQLGYTYEELSERTGVPVATLQKVLGGFTSSPRYMTLQKMEQVLGSESGAGRIREAEQVYDSWDDRYTRADRDALPVEHGTELIDGKLYDMSSPSTVHLIIQSEIQGQLRDSIRANGGNCKVFTAPLDVVLNEDDWTVVQPDVMVVCDRRKIHRQHIWGAPDFVVEVMSASTARKDRTIKLTKYAETGVREYWIVDPVEKNVVVYWLEEVEDIAEDENETKSSRPYISIYGFGDQIPVGIYDGTCEVDFRDIAEEMAFLDE